MKPRLDFLSQEEQELIHNSALWVLSNIGFQMPSHEALDIMRNAGAKIEAEDTVKIPAELVAYAVEKAPKSNGFIQYARVPPDRATLLTGFCCVSPGNAPKD